MRWMRIALVALLTLAGYEALTPVPNGVVLFRYRYTTQGFVVVAPDFIGMNGTGTPSSPGPASYARTSCPPAPSSAGEARPC